jgi:hypothetical protein
MSAATTNSFVPLTTAHVSAHVSADDSSMFQLRVLPQAETKAAFEPLVVGGASAPSSKPCAAPSVTLQRQGEVVSGIRIECGCGQIIELACAY